MSLFLPRLQRLREVPGNYKTELYDPAMEKYQPSPQWINLFVFVKDPENKNLLARQYGPQGSFTFTSQSPGEHQICLHLESIRFALFYDGKLAIHLDMQLGEHTTDYAEFAAKDKLTLLHLRVQQLVEQVVQIQKEQEYQRRQEERFRQTSESTNQRVLWWSILQTFILVATGIWQMQHLKSFFKAKKLTRILCLRASGWNTEAQNWWWISSVQCSNIRISYTQFYQTLVVYIQLDSDLHLH
ncbi:hypothetical protein MC885_000666 [Smutsia gigantea]|nr:hypothetical protein MC885_000666 [Smutsia gigantea]